MVYHNPTAVQARRTGTSFLPVRQLRRTQRKHLQNSSHARIAREARSATLSHHRGTAPRRDATSAATVASSARRKKWVIREPAPPAARAPRAATRRALGAGARASCAFSPDTQLVATRASSERSPGARARRRPRARRERSPGERWVLCRALGCEFPPKNIVATCVSGERSPGARESGKKRTKVTRNAPRRIPRSSAPRRATRSSRASSRRTRRTRGRTSMISRRRSARAP